ncbi:hypothetical protein [Halomonas sp. BMC6]|uniref:hypothetical protein n=1 Tax=Halomonas sp. BMC6 TaxID=3073244 RepID=UPI0030D3DCBA
MKTTKASVTIGRSSKGSIFIRVGDCSSRLSIIEVEMTPENFTECLMGLSFVDARIKSLISHGDLLHVGKRRVVEMVKCDRAANLDRKDQLTIVEQHFNTHYHPSGWEMHSDGIGTKQHGTQHTYMVRKYEAIEESPKAQEFDEIDPNDLVISAVTSSVGFGSHNVGIQITHIPTGIEVSSASERHSHANQLKAMKKLLAELQRTAQS